MVVLTKRLVKCERIRISAEVVTRKVCLVEIKSLVKYERTKKLLLEAIGILFKANKASNSFIFYQKFA